MPTPSWIGATPGQPPLADQVNQFLGTHAATVVYTGAQKDSQSTAGAGSTASNGTWIAQKFTAAASYTSGRVVLTLAVTGSPAPWTLSIQADNAGAPSGTALASATLPNGFVAGGAVSVPLSTAITSGSVYWIVAQAVGDVSNFYSWSKSNQVSGASTSANGSTWTTQAYGLLFQVWDNTVVQPVVHTWEDSGARWSTQAFAASGALTGLKEFTTAQSGSYTQSAATLTSSNGMLTGITQGAATNATPAWSAPRSGLLGDTGAVDASAQVNQLLGTHPSSEIYYGNMILQPDGTGGGLSGRLLDAYDIEQPFTMSGTTIGRVVIPLMVGGAGSDMIVALYTDSGGAPGSLVAQTRIPATWINQLSAVTSSSVTQSAVNGAFATQNAPDYTGSPLATAQFNKFYMASVFTTNWPYPTSGNLGPGTTPTSCYYGDYFIQMGGSVGSTYLSNVFTIGFNSTQLFNAVPQPSLPVATDGTAGCVVSVDSDGNATVVIAGGSTSSGVLTSGVYTAPFDPTTGNLGAWSTQQSLPGTNQYFGMAAYNGYVYAVGGANGTLDRTSVLYAQVQNGQITAWNTTTPLPVAQGFNYVAACAGYLFVFGGFILSSLNTCYYAAINSDGTIGGWRLGPTLPVNAALFAGNPAIVADAYGLIANGSGTLFTLGVTANGPDLAWQKQNFSLGGDYYAGVNFEPGVWRYYGLYSNLYSTMLVSLYATVSVPLPVSGLTNGATYHIVIQSPSNDLNNTIALAFDQGTVFPGNPKYSYRLKGQTAWTSSVAASIPLAIYDNSNNSTSSSGAIGNNHVLHTWEDNGARISTLVRTTTPDSRLIGVLDATAQPGPVLNASPTFTQGLGPWNVFGGSAATSNAFTHGGLPLSARITPTGSASLSYIESDRVPATPGHSFLVSGWFYSPTGYSNIGLSVNWFNSAGSYLSSTTASNISIPANTWTLIQGTVTNNVANATQVDVVCIEGGTPPASAVFYVSSATIQDALGPQVSSVAQIDYGGGFNSGKSWPPTGVTILA